MRVKVPSSVYSTEREGSRWWHPRDCIDRQQLLFPTGNPKNTLKQAMPMAPPGFLLQGQSVTGKPTPPPPKKIPTHCGLGVLSKLLLQNVNLSGVNVRDRESTVTNLPPRERNSPTCRVTESLCISQGHGGWRLHQRGNQQSRGLGDRQSRGLPCWRPSHWRSAWSAGSLAGPDTSPAPPGSRWPVSGRPPLRRDRERGTQFSSASRRRQRVQKGPSCHTPPCSDARCPHMRAAPS